MTTPTPDQSEIVVHGNGGFTITGADGMSVFRALTLASSLKLYALTKIPPTRGVGITAMLKMAGEITKKKYKRTEVMVAYEDVRKWALEMRDAIPTTDNRS